MVPLLEWTCDKCERVITAPREGLLEWITDQKGKNLGYRIVHQACHYKRKELRKRDAASQLPLGELTGSKGLEQLLDFLEKEDHIDRTEFRDIIRRIHVEYYEEARRYWPRALQDGVIQEMNKGSKYDPDFSLSLIQRYRIDHNEKVRIASLPE
jgi:hypothetical protein